MVDERSALGLLEGIDTLSSVALCLWRVAGVWPVARRAHVAMAGGPFVSASFVIDPEPPLGSAGTPGSAAAFSFFWLRRVNERERTTFIYVIHGYCAREQQSRPRSWYQCDRMRARGRKTDAAACPPSLARLWGNAHNRQSLDLDPSETAGDGNEDCGRRK